MLFAGFRISYINMGSFGIAAVALMTDLGVGPAAAGTLLSAFFWTYAALQVPAGFLVPMQDRQQSTLKQFETF
jgi:MFS family permease